MFQRILGEKIKKYFTFKDFFPQHVPFNEIMWRRILEPDRPQM
jgi:hypothetical protein